MLVAYDVVLVVAVAAIFQYRPIKIRSLMNELWETSSLKYIKSDIHT